MWFHVHIYVILHKLFSFIRRSLTSPSGIDPDQLAAENEELRRQIEEQQNQIDRLNQIVQQQGQSDGA